MTYKYSQSIYIFLFLFVTLLCTVYNFEYAHASNIIVSSSGKDLSIDGNSKLNSHLTITNPSQVAVAYNLFVQKNAEIAKTYPPSFILQPNDSQLVTIHISPKITEANIINIVVISKPVDSISPQKIELIEIAVNTDMVQNSLQINNKINMAGLYGLKESNYTIYLIIFLIAFNILLVIIRIASNYKLNENKPKKF